MVLLSSLIDLLKNEETDYLKSELFSAEYLGYGLSQFCLDNHANPEAWFKLATTVSKDREQVVAEKGKRNQTGWRSVYEDMKIYADKKKAEDPSLEKDKDFKKFYSTVIKSERKHRCKMATLIRGKTSRSKKVSVILSTILVKFYDALPKDKRNEEKVKATSKYQIIMNNYNEFKKAEGYGIDQWSLALGLEKNDTLNLFNLARDQDIILDISVKKPNEEPIIKEVTQLKSKLEKLYEQKKTILQKRELVADEKVKISERVVTFKRKRDDMISARERYLKEESALLIFQQASTPYDDMEKKMEFMISKVSGSFANIGVNTFDLNDQNLGIRGLNTSEEHPVDEPAKSSILDKFMTPTYDQDNEKNDSENLEFNLQNITLFNELLAKQTNPDESTQAMKISNEIEPLQIQENEEQKKMDGDSFDKVDENGLHIKMQNAVMETENESEKGDDEENDDELQDEDDLEFENSSRTSSSKIDSNTSLEVTQNMTDDIVTTEDEDKDTDEDEDKNADIKTFEDYLQKEKETASAVQNIPQE